MKLGFVSAILPEYTLEQVFRFAREAGFSSVELMCWPPGKAERRYAGVTHIDVTDLSLDAIEKVQDLVGDPAGGDLGTGVLSQPARRPIAAEAEVAVTHLRRVIDAAAALGVGVVNTFVGRDPALSVDANWPRFLEVWRPLDRPRREQGRQDRHRELPDALHRRRMARRQEPGDHAGDLAADVRRHPQPQFRPELRPVALRSGSRWITSPRWPSSSDRIFHVHAKDARIDRAALDQHGVLSYPKLWHTPKIPGLGDVRWGAFFGALSDVGYDGPRRHRGRGSRLRRLARIAARVARSSAAAIAPVLQWIDRRSVRGRSASLESRLQARTFSRSA